jgi:hypothetical protein
VGAPKRPGGGLHHCVNRDLEDAVSEDCKNSATFYPCEQLATVAIVHLMDTRAKLSGSRKAQRVGIDSSILSKPATWYGTS